ncbi:hypothetical protein SAMN02910353_03113 [Ruminococcus sp. YRD2003]|jgi:hypothetical protein|uniref:hypothetical protein n=1 Tax=Ruminococcus sp. YRD2003 TaxID=1452313 RepID=UPI0008C1C515|nr:hypothetical protein SAMN02910353_03113 [Ruminococcus flavefaciens]
MENVTYTMEPLGFESYFANTFSVLSNEKYIVHRGNSQTLHTEYLEVYASAFMDLWQSCRFHFEIRWSGSIPLQETQVVRVVAHIESGDYIKNQVLNAKIRTNYSKAKRDNTIATEEIVVDFSSKESTIKSINSIQRLLESERFQGIIAKVSEFA